MNVYETLIISTYFKFYWDINISQDVRMSAVRNPWKRLVCFRCEKDFGVQFPGPPSKNKI